MMDLQAKKIIRTPENPALTLRKHIVEKYRNNEVDLSPSMDFSSFVMTNNGFDKWDALLQYVGSMVVLLEEKPDVSKDVINGILSTIASIDIVSDLNDYLDDAVDRGDTTIPISKFCDKLSEELKK